MKFYELKTLLTTIKPEFQSKPLTVNKGRGEYEKIVDVVFCQFCDEWHIATEKDSKGRDEPPRTVKRESRETQKDSRTKEV